MSFQHAVGPFRVAVNASVGSSAPISVTDSRTSQLLWSSANGSFVEAAVAHDKIVGQSGCWKIENHDRDSCGTDPSRALSARVTQDGSVVVAGAFDSPCAGLGWEMRFSLANAAATALSFSLALNASAPQDRLALSYTRYDGERFFGFGQQYTYVDAAGSLVPILAREGGIGRGLEPITSALNAFSRQWGGDERTTYSAVPHYITSSLRSLHLTNTEPCTFDLRHARTVRIEVAATSMRGRILGAASPLALLERTSAFTGRQPPLPAWSPPRRDDRHPGRHSTRG